MAVFGRINPMPAPIEETKKRKGLFDKIKKSLVINQTVKNRTQTNQSIAKNQRTPKTPLKKI